MPRAGVWRAAHASLAARAAALPALLRGPEPAVPALVVPPGGAVVATGVGSSAAHARFLVWLAGEHLGRRARFVPLSAFLAPRSRVGGPGDVLVVFSQGLAPNARLALAAPGAWGGVVLVTAATATGARRAGKPEKARLLAAFARAGGVVVELGGGEEEYGTLLRVTGPMLGYRAALAVARALGAERGGAPLPVVRGPVLARAVAAAPRRLAAALRGRAWHRRTGDRIALLTSGGYADVVGNLAGKIQEGWLRPEPPVHDLLGLAHGPLQQAWSGRTTFLALARRDAPGERAALARVRAALHPTRHRLVRLAATLPGPYAIFEHEAMLTALVLGGIAALGVDQARWPGRGRDAPLYALGSSVRPRPRGARARSAGATLATLAWPELAARLRRRRLTAVVPLGATEQHGPHLPYATDTLVAEALAARFCARVPEAIALPALALGCSPEHAAFPGTLDLGTDTLAAVLGDVLRALARAGFARAFVFSAHGGNVAPLAAALPALRRRVRPMCVDAAVDLARVTAALHAAAARAGVAAPAAGHHAGEVETSIMLALAPALVRRGALAPGRTAAPADPQALFYPSLRAHAPSGVVGDPRGATAARAESYLAAWVDELIAAYRGGKARRQTKGRYQA